MGANVKCPGCGASDLDVVSYDSMMVLRSDVALFSLTCPPCAVRLSVMQPSPPARREEVLFAAIELGAGMGAPKGK